MKFSAPWIHEGIRSRVAIEVRKSVQHLKKTKPLAVCEVCGAFTGERGDVNHRCGHLLYGKRCSGTFKSNLGHVWEECQGCGATGKVGSENCVECSGWGWRLIG